MNENQILDHDFEVEFSNIFMMMQNSQGEILFSAWNFHFFP